MMLLLLRFTPNKTLEHAHRKMMIKSEVDILKTLDHPSIIKYKDYYEKSDTVYIILELFEGQPLSKYLEDRCGETPRWYNPALHIWNKRNKKKVSKLSEKEVKI